MTCRHAPGDPNCSSHWAHPDNPSNVHARDIEEQLKKARKQLDDMQADKTKFEIVDVSEINNNLVLKVRYPSCPKCEFEGIKVMVFLNCNAKMALKWREIDPHFRPNNNIETQAPSPAARFPGTPTGWNDALEYAKSKSK
jgi:hypothetical protein